MIFHLLLSALVYAVLTSAQCDPTKSTCPPIPGLAAAEYSIDFTKTASQPTNWTLADHAVVKYGGSNGAEFTFAKRGDAPYIWSSFYILFGRVEVTLQAAPGQGIITGAVLMSETHDEIDWEWSGSNFNSPSGKVQTNYFGKGITGNYDRGTQPPVDSPTTKFHTYVLDWTPDGIVWSIDGAVIRTQKNTGDTTGSHQHPQTPSRFHLGVWNGGDKDTNPSVVNWAGGYTDLSKVPYTAFIKNVKITTPKPCSSWEFPTGFTGKWQDVKCTNQTLTKNLPCTYNVTAGDYGYSIAKKLDVAYPDLEKANPGTNWDKLTLGQTLKVPGGNCTHPTPSSQDPPFMNGTHHQILNSTTPTPVPTTLPTAPFSNGTAPHHTNTTVMPTSAPQNLIAVTSQANTTAPVTTTSDPTTTTTATATQLVQYTCQKGDYLEIIAKRLNCTVDELKKANPGVDLNSVNIGQVISSCKTVAPATTSPATISPTNTTIATGPYTNATMTNGTVPSTTTITEIETVYMVVKGDYCEKIIEKLQCNQAEFTKANPGVDCNRITVSQTITVPTNAPACTVCKVTTRTTTQTNTVIHMHTATATGSGSTDVKPVVSNSTSCYTYAVAKGDYGYRIAESFGIPFNDLQKANPGVNWDKLWIGAELKIPGTLTKRPTAGVKSSACPASSSPVKPTSVNSTTTSQSSSAPVAPSTTSSTTAVPAPATTTSSSSAMVIPASTSYPMTTTVIIPCPTCAATTLTIPCTVCLHSSTSIVTATNQPAVNTTVTPSSSKPNTGVLGQNMTSSPSTTSSAPVQNATDPCLMYTVAPGEYGVLIAEHFGISFPSLQQYNPGLDWDKLLIGQKLIIPPGSPKQPSTGVASATDCKMPATLATTSTTPSTGSTTPMTSATMPPPTSDSTAPPSTGNSTTPSTTVSTTMSTGTMPTTGTTSIPFTNSSTPGTSSRPFTSTSMSTTAFSNTSSSTTAMTTVHTTNMSPQCDRDNCLRNIVDERYSSSAVPFCLDYIKTASMPIPTYLYGCVNSTIRVSSACNCLYGSALAPPPKTSSSHSTTAPTTTATMPTSSSSLSTEQKTIPGTTPSTSTGSTSRPSTTTSPGSSSSGTAPNTSPGTSSSGTSSTSSGQTTSSGTRPGTLPPGVSPPSTHSGTPPPSTPPTTSGTSPGTSPPGTQPSTPGMSPPMSPPSTQPATAPGTSPPSTPPGTSPPSTQPTTPGTTPGISPPSTQPGTTPPNTPPNTPPTTSTGQTTTYPQTTPPTTTCSTCSTTSLSSTTAPPPPPPSNPPPPPRNPPPNNPPITPPNNPPPNKPPNKPDCDENGNPIGGGGGGGGEGGGTGYGSGGVGIGAGSGQQHGGGGGGGGGGRGGRKRSVDDANEKVDSPADDQGELSYSDETNEAWTDSETDGGRRGATLATSPAAGRPSGGSDGRSAALHRRTPHRGGGAGGGKRGGKKGGGMIGAGRGTGPGPGPGGSGTDGSASGAGIGKGSGPPPAGDAGAAGPPAGTRTGDASSGGGYPGTQQKRSWQQVARDVQRRYWPSGRGGRYGGGTKPSDAQPTAQQQSFANAGTGRAGGGAAPTRPPAAVPTGGTANASAYPNMAPPPPPPPAAATAAAPPTGTRTGVAPTGPPPAATGGVDGTGVPVNPNANAKDGPSAPSAKAPLPPAGTGMGYANTNTVGAPPATAAAAAATKTGTGTTAAGSGSGNAPQNPVASQIPAGAAGGGAPVPEGQANMYVDPNAVPADVAEAAEFAGFKRGFDWEGGDDGAEEDGYGDGAEEEEEEEGGLVKDGYGWAYGAYGGDDSYADAAAAAGGQDGDDDYAATASSEALLDSEDAAEERLLDVVSDVDDDVDGDVDDAPQEAPDALLDSEPLESRRYASPPSEQQGDDAVGVGGADGTGSGGGEWKRQVEERLVQRSARRAMRSDAS